MGKGAMKTTLWNNPGEKEEEHCIFPSYVKSSRPNFSQSLGKSRHMENLVIAGVGTESIYLKQRTKKCDTLLCKYKHIFSIKNSNKR